jgi:hypothetical protein
MKRHSPELLLGRSDVRFSSLNGRLPQYRERQVPLAAHVLSTLSGPWAPATSIWSLSTNKVIRSA